MSNGVLPETITRSERPLAWHSRGHKWAVDLNPRYLDRLKHLVNLVGEYVQRLDFVLDRIACFPESFKIRLIDRKPVAS
jgi:hypothetical protein